MELIRTESLTKYYGSRRGIVDLDLAVEEGEFFGFIGPNGAGKSTTIRTLLGLIRPTSGSAQIFGKDISKEKTSILRDIGYLPAEAIFYPGMRVQKLLKLSADLRGKDCSAQARDLCDRFGLDPERRIDDLSFGNRKKVAIVCALQHHPKLLILDEPTGGLDPLMQKEFFDLLRERNRRGTTILLSGHVLSEIQHNCSRAAIIRDGKIVACDSVEKLSGTDAKRVTIRGRVDLSGLEGARDLNRTNDSVSFLYSGRMERLLEVLRSGRIDDLTLTEPDLDEIFLHYYRKEGESL